MVEVGKPTGLPMLKKLRDESYPNYDQFKTKFGHTPLEMLERGMEVGNIGAINQGIANLKKEDLLKQLSVIEDRWANALKYKSPLMAQWQEQEDMVEAIKETWKIKEADIK